MDASTASNNVEDSNDINISSFYYQVQHGIDGRNASKSTIIKFTKLPEFDFDSKVVWPQKNTYVLQPRLRRIITINDEDPITISSRTNPCKQMSSQYSGRKIVTINENEMKNEPLITNNQNQSARIRSKQVSAKSQKDEKLTSSKSFSRSSLLSRYPNNPDTTKLVSINNTNNESKTITKTKTSNQRSRSNISNRDTRIQTLENRSCISTEKEKSQNNKNTSLPKKTTCIVSKNISIKETEFSSRNNQKLLTCNTVFSRRRLPIITVPLEKGVRPNLDTGMVDCSTEVEKNMFSKEISAGSDEIPPVKVDEFTEPERQYEVVQKHSLVQTDKFLITNYDSLIVPNVTLLKDKNEESKEEVIKMCSKSLPNLQVPALEMISHKHGPESSPGITSKSYIIGRATLTYTTKQKIDFHVVSNKEEVVSSSSSSPLPYPMNVVTVFKKELLRNKNVIEHLVKDDTKRRKNEINSDQVKHGNELQLFNSSHVVNKSKLVKPSELISAITLNNGLLQNDYISEQFQRELNFIDSFFESLQYLESCSMSNKSLTEKNVEHWVSKSGFDVKGPEYDSLFSKFENGTNINDSETMASKSLCLLNLLIRDEQRRAKNLLFVLKMREDALKDFTKSQILWLENKKKHENTDIPTLKKKQRGALLKLQHECGEMQRMRKALLALSEKRKVALMKTKKNIELKLKNNVTVEQMLLGKKKLKRNPTGDRSSVPLKCFDLSSSGCEESTTSRTKSEPALSATHLELEPVHVTTKSAEKSIQTGESLLNPSQVDESTEMAAGNFVSVDGGYLNILFHNLSLPEIFSGGKDYEVNEDALRSIVNSANNRNTLNDSDIVEKFIEQIKNCDADRSSTPSTARSLVEEFDQYYKGLFEDESLVQQQQEVQEILSDQDNVEAVSKGKQNDLVSVSSSTPTTLSFHSASSIHMPDSFITPVGSKVFADSVAESPDSEVAVVATAAGPLPVPAGAAAGTESTSGQDTPVSILAKPSVPISTESSASAIVGMTPLAFLPAPAHSEAEELRRQQLAIEREIKALEQQQSQLLAVREIPDKPPPPYVPPAETRPPRPARLFAADDTIAQKVESIFTDGPCCPEPTDPFDLFIQDFCQEIVDKHKKDQGGKPWDACNLLPQKPPVTTNELIKKTSGALSEVLAGVSPAPVCNMGGRRSDHIDDILFAEWRCYEPQWTAHHADEALVKNQLFDTILQHVLDKTLDEYKHIVLQTKHSNVSNTD